METIRVRNSIPYREHIKYSSIFPGNSSQDYWFHLSLGSSFPVKIPIPVNTKDWRLQSCPRSRILLPEQLPAGILHLKLPLSQFILLGSLKQPWSLICRVSENFKLARTVKYLLYSQYLLQNMVRINIP